VIDPVSRFMDRNERLNCCERAARITVQLGRSSTKQAADAVPAGDAHAIPHFQEHQGEECVRSSRD
jgi:hypothetical protein